MSRNAKFLFDEDFGMPAKAGPEPSVAPEESHREELRQAEEAAFRRGVLEGERQAQGAAAAQGTALLQSIAMAFAAGSAQLRSRADAVEGEAVALAVAMARKLAGDLLERQPLAAIESVVRPVMAQLRSTPHAVVRVNAGFVDLVKPRLDALAHETGFAGTVIVLGEADMSPDSVRVEWADGGVGRDRRAIDEVLAAMTRRYLESLGLNGDDA